MRIVIAVLLATASQAHADVETFPMISLPLTLGGHRTIEDGVFSWGVRPEVIVSRIDDDDGDGWGAGGYAQYERADGNALYAAGLTLVGYSGYGGRSAIALSGGYYEREGDTGLQGSLFFGPRGMVDRDVPLDFPYGFRVDAQFGGTGSVIVSVQLDTTPLLVLVGGLAATLSGGAH